MSKHSRAGWGGRGIALGMGLGLLLGALLSSRGSHADETVKIIGPDGTREAILTDEGLQFLDGEPPPKAAEERGLPDFAAPVLQAPVVDGRSERGDFGLFHFVNGDIIRATEINANFRALAIWMGFISQEGVGPERRVHIGESNAPADLVVHGDLLVDGGVLLESQVEEDPQLPIGWTHLAEGDVGSLFEVVFVTEEPAGGTGYWVHHAFYGVNPAAQITQSIASYTYSKVTPPILRWDRGRLEWAWDAAVAEGAHIEVRVRRL